MERNRAVKEKYFKTLLVLFGEFVVLRISMIQYMLFLSLVATYPAK